VRSKVLPAPLAVIAIACLASASRAQAPADVPADAPHLLNCTVLDTVHLDSNGNLIKDPPLVPGTRALGRVTSFVIDVETAVVRLPGLGNIAWIPAKGDANSAELILTPVSQLASAASMSIHVHRMPGNTRFVFFETDRVMSGTCELLP
jgi:hypothetical protein